MRHVQRLTLAILIVSLLANLAQYQAQRERQKQHDDVRNNAAKIVVGRLKAATEAMQRYTGNGPQGVPELLLAAQALQTADDSLLVLRTESRGLVTNYTTLSDYVGTAQGDIADMVVRGDVKRLPSVRLRIERIYQQLPANMGAAYISSFEAALEKLQLPK